MTAKTLEESILITLEEAGEDDVAALLNTVRDSRENGSPGQISEFRTVLSSLIERGYMELATSRHDISRQWAALSIPASLSLLQSLTSSLTWSAPQQLWVWRSPLPRIQVLLTGDGVVAARNLLSRNGWPQTEGK